MNINTYKTLQLKYFGGPSIIFNSYQERGRTKSKGKHLCEQVIGYDANSLLWCLVQKMLTGKKGNFTKHICYRSESIQWLDHFHNENIVHTEFHTRGGVH